MSVQTLPQPRKTGVSVHKMRHWGWVTVTNIILIGAVIMTALPFLYMISSSFKPQYEIFTFPDFFMPK